MIKRPLLYLLIISYIVFSCKKAENNKNVIRDNRSELEKVIDHYSQNKSDSLKLKAARFLIDNMPMYYTSNCEELKRFDGFFDSITYIKIPYIYKSMYPQRDKYINGKIRYIKVQNIWNHYLQKYGNPSGYKLERYSDEKNISAKLLIENIDYAFKAWEFPWARHLTFEQFCEFVLPYRYEDEPLESWRPFFMEKYKWVIDSIRDKTDPVEVCSLINKEIGTWFQFDGGFKGYPRAFSSSQLLKFRMGPCLMQGAIASFAMRSMGLAISHEAVPQWGDRSLGHDFNSVLNKNGNFIDFLGGEHSPGHNEFKNVAPKIFRHVYSYRNNPIIEADKKAPPKLSKLHFEDVTASYIPVSDVTINLHKDSTLTSEFLYLCVFNNQNWEAVAFSEVKDSKVTFKNMGRNIVYLPAYYNGAYYPASTPFILSNEGKVIPIKFSNEKCKMTLTRKYPYQERMVKLAEQMIGSKFQGANTADFSDAVDLFVVKSSPVHYLKDYPVKNGRYRYVRYVFPPSIPDSIRDGEASELGFKGININGKEEFLKGILIGSSEMTNFQKELFFDGKLDNYHLIVIADTIISDYPKHVITIPEIKPLWVGMDLGRPTTVTKVAYCPRNDVNNIYEHCEYELYYWGNSDWVPIGKRKGQNHRVIFENVPANGLYLLHNLTEGKEERIFTYKNGKQIWW
jgi:hypothetical protein